MDLGPWLHPAANQLKSLVSSASSVSVTQHSPFSSYQALTAPFLNYCPSPAFLALTLLSSPTGRLPTMHLQVRSFPAPSPLHLQHQMPQMYSRTFMMANHTTLISCLLLSSTREGQKNRKFHDQCPSLSQAPPQGRRAGQLPFSEAQTATLKGKRSQ